MTGQPNQKKLKTDLESQSDGTVNITSSSSEKEIPGGIISENLFFIEKQGKSSVNSKLNRVVTVGDPVVLIKDFPHADLYKGYVCTIIYVFGGKKGVEGADTSYEIEFYSTFEDNDNSLKSQKRNLSFEFPITSYTTFVKGRDFIRLVNQDLIYTTCFS